MLIHSFFLILFQVCIGNLYTTRSINSYRYIVGYSILNQKIIAEPLNFYSCGICTKKQHAHRIHAIARACRHYAAWFSTAIITARYYARALYSHSRGTARTGLFDRQSIRFLRADIDQDLDHEISDVLSAIVVFNPDADRSMLI